MSLQFRTLHADQWNQGRLAEILELIPGKKIIVVGDVGIDRYTRGTVERISPEAPVPIVLVQEEKLKLGLAANVADNIQALRGIPLLLGVVGKDRCADDLRALLDLEKIQSLHLVEDPSRRTVLKERIIGERQQMLRIDYESSHEVDASIEKKIVDQFEKLIPHADGIIIEDYAKGTLTESVVQSVVALAQKFQKRVAVDPNAKTSIGRYQKVTVLTPNTKEAESLSGIQIRNEESLAGAGLEILQRTQAAHVVITRGKDGMAIFSADDPVIRLIPTYAKEVYDVSGAGDTVISVLMLSLSTGATIEEASILGNLAGGIEVSKLGTATVTASEILAKIRN